VAHIVSSMLGESPPPAPRDFFGRGELIEKIVGLAENLTPITLIGTGGIGKTSIALTVLHDNRIKQRFGDNRRFIRCDQFPVSRVHFLRRLSEVTGAGIEDPKDLNHLRVFLSSKEMIIVLDNAESILDPQGMSAQEIYATVEELGRFGNICLCITSRISTVPPDCKILNIPTLSTEAARDAFYRVYEHEQSNPVNKILEQLDFHPLSITLLATVAQHNKWDASRLAREWEEGRTGALHTQHSESLGKTIELSLVSPTFRELGPDARWLLGVVAFFPQGINESNLEWFFPTTSNRTTIFNKLCVLSLTYRSDGFIMMLAPLRDYFCPKDPKSSQLLCAIKECYFTRLSVDLYPGRPGFEEARWITSEDVNVEHLFDVFTTVDANPGDIFTTIDANSGDVWDACAKFMRHLYWHKRRPITLGPKINRLPDGHCSKPECLLELSQLFGSIGNYAESKRLLSHALRLQRKRGDDCKVARTLSYLADTHRRLGLDEEGMQLAEEALEIYKRLSDTSGHVQCLYYLAWLLYDSEQLDDAEETASHAINLLPEKGDQFLACKCHRVLGNIYRSRGDREKAINHYETALGIASSFNWHDQLFWGHYSLARLFADEGRSDDALAHTEHAKSHAVNNPYLLGRAMKQQAWFWYALQRLEEARSEALRASDVFERVGATQDLEDCKELLREIGNE